MSREIERTKAYYNKNAPTWSSLKTNSFHHEKEFIKFVSLLPAKASVLDIGCANGVHLPLFSGIGRNLKYTGFDISTTFLKIAKRRYPQHTFLQGNIADQTSLPKKKFDGLFAAAVLMHVPKEQWDTAFKNLERLGKPKAIAYVTLPTEHTRSMPDKNDVRHFTLMSSSDHQKYFKERGWKILHKGVKDGTAKNGIWRWYLVQLPQSQT